MLKESIYRVIRFIGIKRSVKLIKGPVFIIITKRLVLFIITVSVRYKGYLRY